MNYFALPGICWKLTPADDAAQMIADLFKVSLLELKGKSRKAPIPDARHMVFWYLSYTTSMTLMEIGMVLNRDHATALHGIKKVNGAMSHDTLYKIKQKLS